MKMAAAALALLIFAVIGAANAPALAGESKIATSVPRIAPFRAYGINRPFYNRAPAMRRNHSFRHYRTHRHGWRHRHHRRFTGWPAISGPAVIYRNGDVGILPDDDITASIPAPVAEPVVHRVGSRGACDLERVRVSGGEGRTTVNIWRC